MEPLRSISADCSFPNPEQFKPINNGYTRVRGAPVMYTMFCANCKMPAFIYQKDGPGTLVRCYVDRIHFPISV